MRNSLPMFFLCKPVFWPLKTAALELAGGTQHRPHLPRMRKQCIKHFPLADAYCGPFLGGNMKYGKSAGRRWSMQQREHTFRMRLV